MINLLIYEDNDQLRNGFTMLINGTEGFQVLASFDQCVTIEKDVALLKPDVVLLDIDMPELNGVDGLKRLRQSNTEVKVLMLTVFDDDDNVFESIRSGADGYLLKKTPPSRLLEYIKDVVEGGAPMTSSVAKQVLRMFATQPAKKEQADFHLTDRESQTLKYLVDGYSYKMIAGEMKISIDTVRAHIKKIYEKLQVNSKSEAVAKAFKDKII